MNTLRTTKEHLQGVLSPCNLVLAQNYNISKCVVIELAFIRTPVSCEGY